ncbi:MAG: hypothetical protein JXR37_33845 [Kiritimatiellae bacterium]|nr:hypothetical protein [Kiritimatiellia bacterium]
MALSLIGPIWLLVLVLALAGTIVRSVRARYYSSLSWPSIVTTAMPGVIMVVSFYALAVHMHAALGDWPTCIGKAGFPPVLVKHANWTCGYFGAMLLAIIFAWPLAVGICAAVPRLRRFIAHLSLFAGSFAACFALMSVAPSRFLYWWWD